MLNSNIDTAQISAVDTKNLSTTFLAAILHYYEDPEHVRAFEEWKREKEEQKRRL